MKEIWDKKASDYNRFTGELTPFQREFFAKLDEFGVKFNAKTLLDVGCGTGVYSLYLAGLCKSVTGLDLSTKMLEVMREDADKFGITNIKIVEQSWDKFELNEPYDVAFSTMSPAIYDVNMLDKFIRAGEIRVLMWWNKQRDSSLLAPFYKIYQDREWVDKMPIFEEHLTARGVAFKSHIFKEVRRRELDINKAYENVAWHLDIGGIKFSQNEVRDMLQRLAKDGLVTETVHSSMKLLVF